MSRREVNLNSKIQRNALYAQAVSFPETWFVSRATQIVAMCFIHKDPCLVSWPEYQNRCPVCSQTHVLSPSE